MSSELSFCKVCDILKCSGRESIRTIHHPDNSNWQRIMAVSVEACTVLSGEQTEASLISSLGWGNLLPEKSNQ